MAQSFLKFISVCFIFLIGFMPISVFAEDLNVGPDAQETVKQYINSYVGSGGSSGGFSVASIIAMLLFGAVGFIAFMYGKKMSSWKPMTIGILLMGYPYFVVDVFWNFIIGFGLCAALYFFRD